MGLCKGDIKKSTSDRLLRYSRAIEQLANSLCLPK